MKSRLLPLATAVAVSLSPVAYATSDLNADQEITSIRMKQIQQEEEKLKSEIRSLHSEVNQMKKSGVGNHQHGGCCVTVENKEVTKVNIPSAFYFGSTPILSAPYIGVQTMFDGAHLIVNIPSVNEDLRLLQQQQTLYNTYRDNCIPYPKNPYVQFSGKIEGAVNASTPYRDNRTSDINLVGAELDMAAVLNQWAVSFLAFVYDPAPPQPNNPPITRTANSEVYLNKGFLSIGNLNKTPLYGTIGQFVVPFGLYATNMLTPTLTAQLGQLLERAILLGYNTGKSGPYGSIFTFRGDSGTGGTTGHINQLGLNAGYKFTYGRVKTDIGGGYIANIADSNGMQFNGQNSGFTGFGGSTVTEQLEHRVPAVDVRADVAFDKYNLRAEYIDTIRAFSPQNLTFNGSGARPSALNIEASYSFLTMDHPSAVALGYGNTSEALALLIPEQRYSAVYNVAIWRHTIGTLEYRHDINYSAGATATGAGVGVNTGTPTNLGHTSDTVTAQVGVYF